MAAGGAAPRVTVDLSDDDVAWLLKANSAEIELCLVQGSSEEVLANNQGFLCGAAEGTRRLAEFL